MTRICRIVTGCLLTVASTCYAVSDGQIALRQAAVAAIKIVPTTEPAAAFVLPGLQSFFIDGAPPWHGKPTRIFGWFGLPAGAAPDQKFPAVLLVHGGGGSAFSNWVTIWNQHGYAALAIDTCGQLPRSKPWDRDSAGGPPGWGGFDQTDDPPTDQWPYHAEIDCILANSLLRTLPQVDSAHVGIVGISWGGYLTCIAGGLDDRFAFAIPVYGCGFLGEDSAWVPALAKLAPDKSAAWLAAWDPSHYLPAARMPMLWVDGTNDSNYPLEVLQKSYRLPAGPRTLVTRVAMKHSHSAGWAPPEIYAFADSICKNAPPLAKIMAQGRGVDNAWASYHSAVPINAATLNYTTDAGAWKTRKWHTLAGQIDTANSRVQATIPPGTTAYYLNLADQRNLLSSSEHVATDGPTSSP